LGNAVQGRHIQTSPQKKGRFFVPCLFVLYALGSSRNDIRKKALMFFVSVRKKPADRPFCAGA
jgi:hypothetical protein